MDTLPISATALKILDELPIWQSGADILSINKSLRQDGRDGADIATALTQWQLRGKAEAKFGQFAEQMLFTPDGLQQATRLKVAALHAGRVRAAGITDVYDLGCGIGADSLAFASIGINVHAVEIDRETAAIAQFNLRPFDNATVLCEDALNVAEGIAASPSTALWWDPARRITRGGTSRRTFDPEEFSPSLTQVFALAKSHPTGIKLGPGHPHEGIPQWMEAQWVAVGHEAVELGLYSGSLTTTPGRWSALVLPTRGGTPEALGTDFSIQSPAVRTLGKYIVEPNPAVIRARGIATYAAQHNLGLVSTDIAYLTGDIAAPSLLATYYEILEVVPLKPKAINAALRAAGAGRVVIKKRGTDIEPATLRKQLKLSGQRELTVFLTRTAGRHRAIITKPATI